MKPHLLTVTKVYNTTMPGEGQTRSFIFCVICLTLPGCDSRPWNSPYAEIQENNILYSSFSERPKYLDPVRAYSSNEYGFLGQIYEPVLQYHYLKRPYALAPLTARQMPIIRYLNDNNQPVKQDKASYVTYDIEIKPDIMFQPHPAFVRDKQGGYLYHDMDEDHRGEFHRLSDFPLTASRKLRSEDYLYQIKRLADPGLHSPIASILLKHIVGFADLREQITQARASHSTEWIDLRQFSLAGVEIIDDYRYRITVHAGYPQFIYWLSMPFFAPMPWEADAFYSQTGFDQHNITLNWYPVGTGAYMLSENNPNLRMVLTRNPNFRDDRYPIEGEADDWSDGLLQDAGARLPFIDKAIFSLEKESIPYWNKFLQGYYDRSGISSDSFDQAVQLEEGGEFELTEYMQDKNIHLSIAHQPTTVYIGFNMLDPVVGGYSTRAIKLRQALSVAVDIEEYISIFLNGRGTVAQSPLPPGIFGYLSGADGVNPTVYDWVDGKPQRKPLSEARRLLSEAGYANGIDQRNNKPLVLYFDAVGTGPDAKAWLNWITKQFEKLGVQLVVRNTDYNRFQEKIIEGTGQIFRWGWNADYPDPENFLFLFYGPNAKAKKQGENAVNYDNPRFNQLFRRMQGMTSSPARQKVIDEMLDILRYESPWIWGYHPRSFVLHHNWVKNVKPNLMSHNTLKYLRLDTQSRDNRRQDWNQPVLAPVFGLIALLLLFVLPLINIYYKRRRQTIL